MSYNKINLLDLFSGIGGFHKGLSQAGFEFGWVGFSDIDKYSNAVYQHNYPEGVNLGSVTDIQPKNLPKIDCVTFGSPCQDFSIAGRRSGLGGSRSSLISEAIRLITELRPRFFIWENVKGTFSSNDGADFWAIIQAFTNIGGYRLEWQLLNTRWFLPQNRERIYLVGYTGEGSGSKIFPIEKNGGSHSRSKTGAESETKFCTTISTREGGRKENNFVIVDKKLKKKNNQDYAANLSGGGHSGGNHSDMDLVEIADFRNDEGLRIRKNRCAPTLMARKTSSKEPSVMPPLAIQALTKRRTEEGKEARKNIKKEDGKDSTPFGMKEVTTRKDGVVGTITTGNEISQLVVQPVLTPNRTKKRQDGRRFKEDGEPMFTLTGQDQHGVSIQAKMYDDYNSKMRNDNVAGTLTRNSGSKTNRNGQKVVLAPCLNPNDLRKGYSGQNKQFIDNTSMIRRLTPIECCRLQGFPDDWNEKGMIDGKVVEISDTQRYKQCGNAVTVDVVQAVGEKIYALFE